MSETKQLEERPCGEAEDGELVPRFLRGEESAFEALVVRHQGRVFATVRRYARREDEVQDIVQEIFLKVHQKLSTFRGEAPFHHWLMRLAVRTCYDFLRAHQRNKESLFADLNPGETDLLDRFVAAPEEAGDDEDAARSLVERILEQLSPSSRLVITLLEIEERSVKEIAELTGWSQTAVKVRAFRARREMRKRLGRLVLKKYL